MAAFILFLADVYASFIPAQAISVSSLANMNGASKIACSERPGFPNEKPLSSELGPLEVNVIFTNRDATAQALRAALKLAANLDACIRLRAVIAVPMRLPLDHPQISVPFVEKALQDLVFDLNSEGIDVTAHLYLARNQFETLPEVLTPNSLVVIAGRSRPWLTAEKRLTKRLQSKGHRVLFVPVRRRWQ